MAHIQLPGGIAGSLGAMAFSPETVKPLNVLAEVLLHGANSLSAAHREMIATYVSSRNDCYFCQPAHRAVAAYRLNGDEKLANNGKTNFEVADISAKRKAVLAIAGKVQQSGKQITKEDIVRVREQGATDMEIHDPVLIAAAFCLYNRDVDGLATWAPTDADRYVKMDEGLPKKATSSQPHTYRSWSKECV